MKLVNKQAAESKILTLLLSKLEGKPKELGQSDLCPLWPSPESRSHKCESPALSAYLSEYRPPVPGTLGSSNQTSDLSHLPNRSIWIPGIASQPPNHGSTGASVETSWTIKSYGIHGPRGKNPDESESQEHSVWLACKSQLSCLLRYQILYDCYLTWMPTVAAAF